MGTYWLTKQDEGVAMEAGRLGWTRRNVCNQRLSSLPTIPRNVPHQPMNPFPHFWITSGRRIRICRNISLTNCTDF